MTNRVWLTNNFTRYNTDMNELNILPLLEEEEMKVTIGLQDFLFLA